MRTPGPPSPLVRLLVRLFVPRRERDFFLGDLEELLRHASEKGRCEAGNRSGSERRSVLRELAGVLLLRFGRLPSPGPSSTPATDGILAGLLQDLRFAWRMTLRSPGFTVVALVTMIVGIGANTAMFSLVHDILIKPLPYPEAERIVYLRETNQERGWAAYNVSPPNYWDWEERNRSLDLLAAFRTTTVTHKRDGHPEVLAAQQVTEDYLGLLGGEPALGRRITAADLEPDADRVLVLSHGFWQRAFGRDPAALGGTMVLDGMPRTVVGITPAGWRPASGEVDVFVPLVRNPSWLTRRSAHFLTVVGRLAPGVTLDQARVDLSSVAAGLARAYPDTNSGSDILVQPLEEVVLGSSGTQLLILLGAAGMVLLIACANLANMTLAKATARQRELAVRLSLGAGRRRVVRQLLVESLLLAVLGGALGVALAQVALSAFAASWPLLLPREYQVVISLPVFLFSAGLTIGSGILFGLAPAVLTTESGVSTTLGEGSRSVAGGRAGRWIRRGLVVAEVTAAVVLLIGSGLLVRSFSALQREDPGFLTENRLVFTTRLPLERYETPDQIRAFVRESLAWLQALPGVESVGISSLVPITGADEVYPISFDGLAPDDSTGVSALLYRVSPGYLGAMGIPILAGREIRPADREGGRPVAVVTQSFVDRNYPGKNPLGRRIRLGGDPVWVEIVGVAGDVQHYQLGVESLAQIYVSFDQRPVHQVNFVLRSSTPPLQLVPGVRVAIGLVDPDQPVAGIQLADDLISRSVSLPRFRALLMAGFGLTALFLAVIGLYGVMAYSVSRRSGELGIRIALGAEGRSILALVLRESMSMVGIGLALGLGAAFGLSRVLRSLLFEVGETDPVVFGSVPALLLAVALLAVTVPARRASRTDPVTALRST